MPPQDTSGEEFRVSDRRGQRGETEPARQPGLGSTPVPDTPAAGPAPVETGPRGRPELPPEPDLSALFFLLANSALLHLGEAPEAVDLAQAKFSIDLLELLKEKTEGNRSPDESRLLEGILYDLQMRFVRAVPR